MHGEEFFSQGAVRANFGPCFIKRYDIPGANAVSELQPMNSEDRLVSGVRVRCRFSVDLKSTMC